jgi:regulator of protease activity HflC (stomatin/prohibitin superfamily)
MITVPQDRWYAVEKFGKFQKIFGPGLHFVGCDCCGACVNLRSITNRVSQNEITVSTKTQDNVFLVLKVAVQQSVIADEAEAAFYKLNNVNEQIEAYVSDVVRSQVPKMTLDEVFEKKDDISDAIQRELYKNMANYGFQIMKALVTELTPARGVVDAMNEINTQKRLRDAALMAAEGDKVRIVKAAEAAADSAHLQGQGIARQRSAIIDGLRESVSSGTGEVLSSEKITELLLITQYFETLRDIGASSKAQTIFIPHSANAGIGDISAQIRNGMMQASSAPTQAKMANVSV